MSANKGIILDRDGTLNIPPPVGQFITHPDELQLIPNTASALKKIIDMGYLIAVATNQSCINRGIATSDEVDAVNCKMSKLLADAGVELKKIYVCPHTEIEGCDCRKPKSEMFTRAISELNLDPALSFGIGDTERDIIAAKNAGLNTCFVTAFAPHKKILQPTDYTFGTLLEFAEHLDVSVNFRKNTSSFKLEESDERSYRKTE